MLLLAWWLCLCLASFCFGQSDRSSPKGNFTYIEKHRLCILLDAGSTGTKLRIFSWPFRTAKEELPDVTMIYSEKFEPSLDSFSNRQSEILPYLRKIISKAKTLIPKKMFRHTPIYLFMTAGARFLEGSISRTILESSLKVLYQIGINPFFFRQSFLRVLSGEEEGAYSWIAVNYLQKNFNHDTPDNKMVGVLEMGGGSTQIAFLSHVPVYANKFNIHLYGRSYGIYSQSYLYYGQYYMEVRINRYLARRMNPFSDPVNPCMLRGDVISFTHANSSVLIRGGGNWRQCESILHYFLQSSPNEMCYPKPCAIGPVYQPTIERELFYAIAGFAYNAKDLEVLDNGNSINLYMMRGKAIAYCNNTIQTVMETTNIAHQYLSSLCMMGLYIPMLLTQAYGFSPFTKNIIAATDIDKKEISWSLGAIVHEIQYLDIVKLKEPSAAVSLEAFALTVLIGILTSYTVMRRS